mmetsp:Transcript_11254/g.38430  ORF Transcript_11254/g.38430 Transcript_11254/m.38430 type:complete len:197 (-) Transcript_11254:1527-2117(-)
MSSDEQKNPEQQKASKDDGRVRAGANGLEPLWPTSVKYLKENDWDEISGSEREWFCVTRLQGVQVRFIHHDGHPCKGQRGLFAIRVWEPFEVLGEYCGVVKVPNDQEARQCDSDYAVAVYKSATWTPFIDASRAGNETRFINDFRGVAGSPNCKFSQSHVGGRPAILVVITRQVKEEEELLVDYGDVYWAGSTYRE